MPQGGGDAKANHRCPGEDLAIEVTRRCIRLLTTAMHYEVPEQDLSVDLGRMPAQPASGLVLRNVHPSGTGALALRHETLQQR